MELYKNANPELIAIGSSRAMQVMAKFFNVKFINLGGSVNSIPELDYVVKRIIEMKSHPKIVIIFADVWWFNENFQSSRGHFFPQKQPDYLTLATARILVKPILKNGFIFNNESRLGFGAKYQNQGYDRFGSFHYVSTVTGFAPSTDFHFEDTFNRIDRGVSRFEYSDDYSLFGLNRLNEITNTLNNHDIHTIIVLPPFANLVYKKMAASGKYNYISKLVGAMEKTNFVFNFTNPDAINGANDCQFIDGFHGGETVYAEILRQISEKDVYLKKSMNFHYLSYLAKMKGVSSPETIRLYGEERTEFDFLGLGCR